MHLARERQDALRMLDGQIAATAPARKAMLGARAKWNLFRSYLPGEAGGSRRAYLNIIYEITKLFPSTGQAYVTELTITPRMGGSVTSTYDITIRGQAITDDVATNFIKDLQSSSMFQEAKQGTIARESGGENPLYPVRFSVTCNLSRGQVVVGNP